MKKFYQRLCNIELALAAICLVATVTIISAAALLRTFGHPINWGLDIALWLFSWSVFLGADNALRNGKMVNVDMLLVKLPIKVQKALKIFDLCLIIVFLALLTVLGVKQTWLTRFRPFQGIPTMSYSWVTLSVPLCSFLMIITSILKIRDITQGKEIDHAECDLDDYSNSAPIGKEL